MKKYLYLIATLVLLGSCTLSMEDWVLKEEERGMDEPYTEHTEFGDVTYEFQDSVIYLTENLQDKYLIRVEHDSILYINGNIPNEYRPYIGQKIAAGFGYEFPNSLMGRVISVEDVGGILKVTTTTAKREEVFKHLSYDLEWDGIVQNIGVLDSLSNEDLEQLGYQRLEDSTIVDWNTYDSIQISKGNKKAIARMKQRQLTRADSKIEEVKDEVEDLVEFGIKFSKDESGYSLHASENTGGSFIHFPDVLYETYKELVLPKKWKESLDVSLEINFKAVQHVHSVAKRDEEQGWEMNYTDTKNVITIGLEAGVSHSFLDDKEDDPSDFNDFLDKMKNYESLSEKAKNSLKTYMEVYKGMEPKNELKKLQNQAGVKGKDGKKRAFPMNGVEGSFTVPLGPWFCIKFSVGVEPICEITGVGSIEVEITSKKKRAGVYTHGDFCQKLDEEFGQVQTKVTKLSGKLSGKIGFGARVAAAVEFLHTAGVEIGVNLEAAVAAELEVDFAKAFDSGTDSWIDIDGNIRGYIEFWADARFYVEPLGFSLWETNIGEWPDPHANIMNVGVGMKPKVDEWSAHEFSITDGEDGKKELNAYVAMKYKSLGMASIFNTDHPLMRMYKGPIDDGKFVYVTPVVSKEDPTPLDPTTYPSVSTGDTYHYRYQGEMEDDLKEIHFVPALVEYKYRSYLMDKDWDYNVRHNLKEGGEVLLKDDEYPLEIGEPNITTLQAKQLYAGQCKDASIFNGGGTYVSSNTGKKSQVENMSVDYRKFSDFKFMSQIKIYRASSMRECYLDVYLYNSARKKITKNPIRIPLGTPHSGIYTFLFNFTTDWKPTGIGMSTITSEEGDEEQTGVEGEYLFFRVIPYFINDETGEKVKSSDSKSHKYYTLEYPLTEIKIDENNKTKWGTVMPEYDLNR